MTSDNEYRPLMFTFNVSLSGDWEKDKVIISEAAQQSTAADAYYDHASAIMALFNLFTYGTPAEPNHPQRAGLLRKVHDELYPIAHFAKLYFTHPKNVLIQWVEGNQQHDAILEYAETGSNQSDIRYLEVTTLQGMEDAKKLEDLSKGPSVTTVNSFAAQEKHQRKLVQLDRMLKKKTAIDHPEQTALLVYTDEDRFRQFHYGMSAPQIDKKKDYEEILRRFESSLANFSHVFIYSRSEIYCAWTSTSEEPGNP